jgi:hypothetical protein
MLGRVARQGDRGSHEFLLLHDELAKLCQAVVEKSKESAVDGIFFSHP